MKNKRINYLRVNIFPDGGISRIGTENNKYENFN